MGAHTLPRRPGGPPRACAQPALSRPVAVRLSARPAPQPALLKGYLEQLGLTRRSIDALSHRLT